MCFTIWCKFKNSLQTFWIFERENIFVPIKHGSVRLDIWSCQYFNKVIIEMNSNKKWHRLYPPTPTVIHSNDDIPVTHFSGIACICLWSLLVILFLSKRWSTGCSLGQCWPSSRKSESQWSICSDRGKYKLTLAFLTPFTEIFGICIILYDFSFKLLISADICGLASQFQLETTCTMNPCW